LSCTPHSMPFACNRWHFWTTNQNCMNQSQAYVHTKSTQ
jgi:hypothetical protein